MNNTDYSTPLSLKNIYIEDEFWKKEMELVRTEMLPYQWEILNDRIEDAPPSFCMRNFQIAGKITKAKKEQGNTFKEPKYTYQGFEVLPEDINNLEDKFYGFVFQDSDFSKWIEAAAYSLINHPDEDLQKIADNAIDIVCAAQQPNGYLDTYYIINGMDKAFTNLRDHHELYCFGHLVEGAVAYYQATGKDKLLKAAIKFADYIDSYFGENKCKGYPGHEIAEMALVRLYEVTGDKKYLNLSKFFIYERGKQPYYWDNERDIKSEGLNYQYNQAHIPVIEQSEAVGHAVRAMYLYSGMADIAKLTNDERLLNACKHLWDSIVNEKMYITGGIGATSLGEAFSFPYDLPNDLAYSETCAAIGLIFFARRMLQIEANSKYADIMELALYNTVLSGMSLDGKSFFYVNPLEVLPEACHKDERKKHVKPVRQKWFGCACCPPNIARLISSIPSYAYTETDNTLFMHLYIGGRIQKQIGNNTAEIKVSSNFPWNGTVTIEFESEHIEYLRLALRIPSWSENWQINVSEDKKSNIKTGYYYIEGSWKKGDKIVLEFEMTPKFIKANSKVIEDIGKVALVRGPIVFCIEEADNLKGLHLNSVIPNTNIEQNYIAIQNNKFITLYAKGKRLKQDNENQTLYQIYKQPKYEDILLKFIPYYTWANRGEGEMQVWIKAFN